MNDNLSREQEYEEGQGFTEIDLWQIFAVLLRWKWLIITITILGLLAAYIVSYFILPPVYEAQSTLLVVQGESNSRQQTSGDDLESLIGNISRLPEMTIKTYVEQIKDPVLLGEVVRELKLDILGYKYNSLQGMITATAIKDTNLIEVRVRNTDPQLAEEITGTLVERLLDSISRNTQEQMTRSVIILQQQAQAVQKQLDQEREKQKILESKPRSLEYLEQEQVRVGNDLNRYKSMLPDAEIARSEAQAASTLLIKRLETTPRELNGSNNPAYTELVLALNEKEMLLTEHEAQIISLNEYISRLETDYNTLQTEITARRIETLTLNNTLSELEKTISLLNEKITQTQITKSVNLGETSLLVVSPALLNNSPVAPNKRMNMAVAGLLGLLFSSLLVFVLEKLDNKIRSKEDLEKYLGLPVLGEIPKFKSVNPKENVPEQGGES